MAQVLIRRNSGPFFGGQIHAEKNQDIEVENDETHWVGHDRFAQMCSNLQNLLKAGARFPVLEFGQGAKNSQGLRALDFTVARVEQLRDGGKWATMTPRSIIAILIGL